MDTKTKAGLLKHELKILIKDIQRDRRKYVNNPLSDFTRRRKLPMDLLINSILNLGSSSLNVELYDTGKFKKLCTASAFVQQRGKLVYTAFEKLFHDFSDKCAGNIRLFKGFRLLAVDGSDIVYPAGEDNSFMVAHKGQKKLARQHLNAAYDIMNRYYTDACIDINEVNASVSIIDNASDTYPNLFIADRGYENYNLMAHIEENLFDYVIRIKDIHSSGMAAPFDLPDTEFDETREVILTRKYTGGYMSDSVKYRYLSKKARFDYINSSKDDDYCLSIRFVRFRLSDDTYETIATSVDESILSMEDIKDIYSMRWNIETGFRKLKNDICLKAVHSSKDNAVKQEIFARLIMFNFASFIINCIQIKQNKYKHRMIIQFKNASRLCRLFYKDSCKDPPDDFEVQLLSCLSPIRQGRKYDRKVRPQGATAFNYRNI